MTRFVTRYLRAPFVISTTVAVIGLTTTASTAVSSGSVESISRDLYSNADSQHASQVEPDSFAYGNTIVTAVQTGRFWNGGASNINFSTSTDGGATWTTGGLPRLTNNPAPGVVTGPFDRVSDPVVAYDAVHDVWMISSLPLVGRGSQNARAVGVYTSRSTDGGLTWGAPILVTGSQAGSPDKNWIVCDNSATSPYRGNCYTEWDDNRDGNRIYMSTSTDGGLTWGPRQATANGATGLGGQPLVQPNGTVIVPITNAYETVLRAFRSTDGGRSWSATKNVTAIQSHEVGGGLRTGPLPSAEIDADGRVYVAWQDCRFRTACAANDIVFSTTTDGVDWTPIRRIPIDAKTSGIDHYIPALAVDPATAGASAHLALAYYSYPVAACAVATCSLRVGFISSTDGGSTWSSTHQLGTPMSLSWLPNTTQGRMVGDYISTSFVAGTPFPVYTAASPKNGQNIRQSMVIARGLTVEAGSSATESSALTPEGSSSTRSRVLARQ